MRSANAAFTAGPTLAAVIDHERLSVCATCGHGLCQAVTSKAPRLTGKRKALRLLDGRRSAELRCRGGSAATGYFTAISSWGAISRCFSGSTLGASCLRSGTQWWQQAANAQRAYVNQESAYPENCWQTR